MSLAEDLRDEIATVVDAAERTIVHKVRLALNESGVSGARKALEDVEVRLVHAMASLRDWQEREREAKEAVEEAEVIADWNASTGFEKSGSSFTYEGRPCTADQKKGLTAVAVAKDGEVVAARGELRDARQEREAAADLVTQLERGFIAARLALEAAVAHLNLYSNALRGS